MSSWGSQTPVHVDYSVYIVPIVKFVYICVCHLKYRCSPGQNGRHGRLPGGPRSKTAGTCDFPAAPGQKRPVRARSTTGPETTADTFTVFGGAQKSGRYVYGFRRAPKKRPIRLRFLAGPKKAADTFTVFGGPPKSGQYVYGFRRGKKNGRYVYGFWRGPKKRPTHLRFLAQVPPLQHTKLIRGKRFRNHRPRASLNDCGLLEAHRKDDGGGPPTGR